MVTQYKLELNVEHPAGFEPAYKRVEAAGLYPFEPRVHLLVAPQGSYYLIGVTKFYPLSGRKMEIECFQ